MKRYGQTLMAVLLTASWPPAMARATQDDGGYRPRTGEWSYGTAPRGQAEAVVSVRGRNPNSYFRFGVACTGIPPYFMIISVLNSVEGISDFQSPAYLAAWNYGASNLEPVNAVVTYRNGVETDRFEIDEGVGADSPAMSVTRRMLTSLSSADRIVVTGKTENMEFSARGSAAAIRSIMGDCEISG